MGNMRIIKKYIEANIQFKNLEKDQAESLKRVSVEDRQMIEQQYLDIVIDEHKMNPLEIS